MEDTPSGMVMEARLVQSVNAALPMKVTLPGMETEVRKEQLRNAALPMEVTLSGMETEVRLHCPNAPSPMARIPCGTA